MNKKGLGTRAGNDKSDMISELTTRQSLQLYAFNKYT